MILGLPGESRDDMLATARELARLASTPSNSTTSMPSETRRWPTWWPPGEVRLPSSTSMWPGSSIFWNACRPGASSIASAAMPRRSTWSGPIGVWTRRRFVPAIEAELRRRNTWQGREYSAAAWIPAARNSGRTPARAPLPAVRFGGIVMVECGVDRMAAGRGPHEPPYRLDCGLRREESPGSAGRGDG